MKCTLLGCLCCLLFALPLHAQQAAAVQQMTLDVIVTDHSGKPVTGLQEHDFALTDDKHPQNIVSLREITPDRADAEPTELIILIDEVNTSFQSVAFERQSLDKFLGRNGGQLPVPVSLAYFSDTGTEFQKSPTRDGKALIASFDEHTTNLRTVRRSAGFWGAEERFELSLRTMSSLVNTEQTKPGRKILLWISPGWPYLSGPQINLTGKEQQGLFQSVVAISTMLRKARMTVYSIDPLGTADAAGFRTIYYREFLKGVAAPKDVQAGNLSLQVIATQSGGRALSGNNNIDDLIALAASESSFYYALSFEPAPSERANEYHAIDVKVERSGAETHTRTGYYTQP